VEYENNYYSFLTPSSIANCYLKERNLNHHLLHRHSREQGWYRRDCRRDCKRELSQDQLCDRDRNNSKHHTCDCKTFQGHIFI